MSLANVYSGFGSISNAFYLYMVMARACSCTPYCAHAHTSRGCGYRVRLSTPCNNIQLFLQQCEKSRVNGDSHNSHYKVLGTKQTVEWHFTSSDLKVTLSHAIVILLIPRCQLSIKRLSHVLLQLYKYQCNFHSNHFNFVHQ